VTTERGASNDKIERAQKREDLLAKHSTARAKREAAALDSKEYRAAAEEIARIEIQINRLEEPD